MTLTKKIPIITAITLIATILLIPQGMNSTFGEHLTKETFAGDPRHHFPDLSVEFDPAYVEDTIGDVKIRALFHFNKDGMETIDSFRIINQLSGFSRDSPVVFQLLGGVGADKDHLYTAADKMHERNFVLSGEDYSHFDVDVYLYHRGDETAFRHFAYQGCDVVGYSVTTLHDGDETYSGLTKFVLADTFTFDCEGMLSHCPMCIMHRTIEVIDETISSQDLRDTQTWSDIYRYENP